jgi:hypothetical protein
MASQSPFDPQSVLPKVREIRKHLLEELKKRKKIYLGVAFVVVVALIINGNILGRKPANSISKAQTVTYNVDKSYDFPALNNQGKATTYKIKFKVTSAEKTNQVIVNDKVYTAKNDKLFLILNLELKNDASQPLNILPGDLVRIAYNGDEDNKYAPDLHNNLVAIAAISTKLDRIGFVIPQNTKDIKLYIGELEGKKETVEVHFPS